MSEKVKFDELDSACLMDCKEWSITREIPVLHMMIEERHTLQVLEFEVNLPTVTEWITVFGTCMHRHEEIQQKDFSRR